MTTFPRRQYLSGVILVSINLVPLIGVIFLNWNIFSLLLLYWLENIVIGLYNILKIYKINGFKNGTQTALFFTLHYGFFIFLHGIFIIMLFASFLATSGAEVVSSPFLIKWSSSKEFVSSVGSVLVAFILLIFSHGLSCYINFFKGNEYKKVSINRLFFRPYKRILLTDLAILLGGTIIVFLRPSLWSLALFVILKLFLDLFSHISEHSIQDK